MVECRAGKYNFCLTEELGAQALAEITGFLESPAQAARPLLGGRGGLTSASVHGIGAVVIKHYVRGGWLRFLVRSAHLRLGKLRPQKEFELLERVRALGVNAPQALGYVYCGSLVYSAWLLMRQLKNTRSLAELAMYERESLEPAVRALAAQIGILVQHGVLHVDLHPGNVLIDARGEVFVIDFDKARLYRGPAARLRDLYIWRWRRAVIKHRLPDELAEIMCLELRRLG